MFRRLRLFVDLLEDLLDVACLTAIVGIAKKDASEERVLLASFGAFHLVAREVGARVWRQLRYASLILPD